VIEGVRAAVFDGAQLLVVDDLEVPEPGPDQVTVRVLASGICHSDLNVIDRTVPVPPPVVLGHEAAGVVDRVGSGVNAWAPGDEVLVSGITPCGSCHSCRTGHPTACVDAFGRGATPFRWRGEPVRSYAQVSSFASFITVEAQRLSWITGIPATKACVIGCAVTTGYGAVKNVAEVVRGDRVAVLGMGGVGVNAVQTARLLGAAEIVAIDVNPDKEAAARQFGATRFAAADDPALRTFDAVIECSGAPAAIDAAIGMTSPGGTTALVGLPPVGHRASFDVGHLIRGRRIVGSLAGDIVPERDTRDIVEHIRAGRLDLDGVVSKVWPLAEIAWAMDALRTGAVIRPVLDLS
jgi:S-(hydroxymethyl)glutathione dehydrogenase / alcohol dehydrogenase